MKNAQLRGFTLLELLVVISIIGLLTTMVIVNFRRGEYSSDLRQGATELLQNIRLAQQYTVGGNSINYCVPGSPRNNYYSCPEDNYCCEIPDKCSGACKNGVPLGGYGLAVTSTNDYQIFGDTDDNGVLSDPDYVVINNDLLVNAIHISKFKIGGGGWTEPGGTSVIVRFSPPEGTAHLYYQSERIETTAIFQLTSDNITGICREVMVNRISGQVSEQQGVNCNP